MAAPMDLNLNLDKDKKAVFDVLQTAIKLGYNAVAINTHYELQSQKKGKNKQLPVKLENELKLEDNLFSQLKEKCKKFKQYSRITVEVSDPSTLHKINDSKVQEYDIVAVQPTTDKLFHMACMQLDVDVITFDMTEKLPFKFKRESINEAVRRGVYFEIYYSPALKDTMTRRYTIGNAQRLMNVCKGKNIVLSSKSERGIDLRGPHDVANLGYIFGLQEQQAKAAVTANCRAVLLHAEARKLKPSKGVMSVKKFETSHSQESKRKSIQEANKSKDDQEPPKKKIKTQNND